MALRLRARRASLPWQWPMSLRSTMATTHAWLPTIWGWPMPASSFSVSMPKREPTQENQLEASPMENLKIIPLLVNISLCKTQSITTETKPQVLNPYQETKFTNGIPALSSPWLTCDNCLVSLSDFFSFSFPGWLNCKNIHWTKISLLMVSLRSLDDVRSWKVDGSLKMAGMGVIEEAVFREDG